MRLKHLFQTCLHFELSVKAANLRAPRRFGIFSCPYQILLQSEPGIRRSSLKTKHKNGLIIRYERGNQYHCWFLHSQCHICSFPSLHFHHLISKQVEWAQSARSFKPSHHLHPTVWRSGKAPIWFCAFSRVSNQSSKLSPPLSDIWQDSHRLWVTVAVFLGLFWDVLGTVRWRTLMPCRRGKVWLLIPQTINLMINQTCYF